MPDDDFQRLAFRAAELLPRRYLPGLATRLFAALNAISPRLAAMLPMRRYGLALCRFLDPPGGLSPGGGH